MSNPDLTVIIPARNEQYLQRTIENILTNARGEIEILAVCDGYWPDPPIQDHPRVNIIHHSEARGQRQSINEAAKVAKGKYLMKLDAHCAVAPGFDTALAADYQEGWTVVPRMYNLDTATWTPKLHKRTDYMYIGFNEKNELRTLYYTGDEYRKWHSRSEEIDETMSCMGPGWFLSADTYWKQGGCDEGHGSWGQQGVEVALKAWLSGGALMVNKKTWFAHWFRASDGGFPYPISGREVEAARNYSKELWLNNRWPGQVKPLSWLVDKFNPPGWEKIMDHNEQLKLNSQFYQHIHTEKREPIWRGVHVIKMPSDLLLYEQVIWENKPDFIVEIGTCFGGSALFFQDALDRIGAGGQVITIDIKDRVEQHDPRITYLLGDGKSLEIVDKVKELTAGKSVMVVVDGYHGRSQVKWELHRYSEIVTPGQYMVVEDCYSKEGKLYQPGQARDWFLTTRRGRQFEQTNLDQQYLIGFCVGGWLRRRV